MLQHDWSLGLQHEHGLIGLSQLTHDVLHWHSLRGCNTNSPLWVHISSIVVFSTRLQNILPTTVCLCLKFLFTSIYHLPGVSDYLFHVLATAPLKAVHFLLLDQQPVIHCRWIQSINTSECYTLLCSTNQHLLTYLLFYLLMLICCFFLLSD